MTMRSILLTFVTAAAFVLAPSAFASELSPAMRQIDPALEKLDQACDSGDSAACEKLGGRLVVAVTLNDKQVAVEALTKACNAGRNTACTRLEKAKPKFVKELDDTCRGGPTGRYAALPCEAWGDKEAEARDEDTVRGVAVVYTNACRLGSKTACDKQKAYEVKTASFDAQHARDDQEEKRRDAEQNVRNTATAELGKTPACQAARAKQTFCGYTVAIQRQQAVIDRENQVGRESGYVNAAVLRNAASDKITLQSNNKNLAETYRRFTGEMLSESECTVEGAGLRVSLTEAKAKELTQVVKENCSLSH